MSESASRFDRFLGRLAGLGAGSRLHPAELLQRIHDAAAKTVSNGAMANAYTVSLAPDDYLAVQPALPDIRSAAREVLTDAASQRQLTFPGPITVTFQGTTSLQRGDCVVTGEFRNPASAGLAGNANPTAQITRQRGKYLVVEGFGRFRLTHTPFTLGRAPDCDLSIPDLSVSRKHARIESAPGGALVIHDAGSRNRIRVGDSEVDEAGLVPGMEVHLGSVAVRLEVDA